jgi:hypothetical protein
MLGYVSKHLGHIEEAIQYFQKLVETGNMQTAHDRLREEMANLSQ